VQVNEQHKQINEDPSKSGAFGPSPSTTLINEEPNTPSRGEGERNSELGDNKNLQQTSTSFTPFGGQGAEASEIVSPVSKQDNSTDYIGAFAVTIHGAREHIDRFASQNDEYNKIMVQILADRFVEAFAECLHEKTRKEFWGYEKNENLTNQQLIKEEYKGIRPAPGYPACPDHTEKIKLFDLLKVTENIGIELTESLAMNPPASVCGWYIAHPQSHYFGLGKIQRDQLEDYAKRKGMPIEEAERWLRPVLE
jgi:5-methyltetrahydrofolate--homocysteine methyltransferase